ncbi:MAG: winged helix-turn-helix transcriptional regulator [Candidatus Lokiarchaeota archaeon]|nr:winged helix-turn-helix transcriptional regulator [Candidatus Lokiarchaeota archaeon]
MNIITKNKNLNKFERKIINFLKTKPSGSTISDIARGVDISRTTATKYVDIMEKKEIIYKKKIGNYVLCFTSDRDFLPKQEIIESYKGFLYGLKKIFPSKKKEMKKIGRAITDYYIISFDYIMDSIKDSLSGKNKFSLKNIVEIFENIIPYQTIFQDPIKLLAISVNEKGKEFKLKYGGSEFLKEDLEYHLYVLTGYIEALYEKAFGREIHCDIDEIKYPENDEESYMIVIFRIGPKIK